MSPGNTSTGRNRASGSRARVFAAWLAVASVGGLLSGCASGGVQAYTETLWREDMGRITRGTLEDGLDKMIRKYGLQLNRQEEAARDLYYETVWTTRDILAVEEAQGVNGARNRIVIQGRRLEAGVFRFSWELQNQVTTASTPEWHAHLIPPEVVEEYRPIYSDLMLEVRTGVRRQAESSPVQRKRALKDSAHPSVPHRARLSVADQIKHHKDPRLTVCVERVGSNELRLLNSRR